MSFNGIEARLGIVRRLCQDPRIVIAGGGNDSEKDHLEMWIKASGSSLSEMTLGKMALVKRHVMEEALAFEYDKVPDLREKRYKKFILDSRVDQSSDSPRPSVETAVHQLLKQYVLHTHPTALTILSSVRNAPGLLEKICPELDYMTMPYLDPGILLGKKAQSMIQSANHVPSVLMQRNHGMFFTSDNFEQMLKLHNYVVGQVQEYIDQRIMEKGLDVKPFGRMAVKDERQLDIGDARRVMYQIYSAITNHSDLSPSEDKQQLDRTGMGFSSDDTQQLDGTEMTRTIVTQNVKGENEKTVVMLLDTSYLARQYACSEFARRNAGEFSWACPDYIVSMDKTEAYLYLNDPLDSKKTAKDIKAQVRLLEGNMYSRVFVLPGIGIMTMGGHNPTDAEPYVKAENAMMFARDALLFYQGTNALGGRVMLNSAAADFVMNWEVEKARRVVMQKK